LANWSTRSPPETVLEDSDFRSWLKYKSAWFKWLHRSAYDYISGDLEADLLAWAQGVDTSLDMLNGCVWLHKYGLSVWTYNDKSEIHLYTEAVSYAQRIIDVVGSRTNTSPDDGYQALDIGLTGLSSPYPDRWLQLYPKGQSHISCAMVHEDHSLFWVGLVASGFTDYVVSRFEWFKHDICAHCVSFRLLTSLAVDRRSRDTLMALFLDHLINSIHADTTVATAPLPNLHQYRYDVAFDTRRKKFTISWFSHGKCDEYVAMRRLYKLISYVTLARSSMSPSFRR
jgi:hypothetical protein